MLALALYFVVYYVFVLFVFALFYVAVSDFIVSVPVRLFSFCCSVLFMVLFLFPFCWFCDFVLLCFGVFRYFVCISCCRILFCYVWLWFCFILFLFCVVLFCFCFVLVPVSLIWCFGFVDFILFRGLYFVVFWCLYCFVFDVILVVVCLDLSVFCCLWFRFLIAHSILFCFVLLCHLCCLLFLTCYRIPCLWLYFVSYWFCLVLFCLRVCLVFVFLFLFCFVAFAHVSVLYIKTYVNYNGVVLDSGLFVSIYFFLFVLLLFWRLLFLFGYVLFYFDLVCVVYVFVLFVFGLLFYVHVSALLYCFVSFLFCRCLVWCYMCCLWFCFV